MSGSYKEPFYEAEIKTSGCGIELLVNDCFSFSNYRPGGLAVDWPINEFILETGIQYIKVKGLPFDVTKPIIKPAYIQVNIYVREAHRLTDLPRKLIYSFNTGNTFEQKDYLYYENEFTFNANVPYKISGWKKSMDLSKLDKDELFKQLSMWDQKLFDIFVTKNQQEYLSATKDRYEELSISNFYTEEEKQRHTKEVFIGVSSNIKSMPSDYYKLAFYGNGKIISLKSLKYPPGFFYEATDRKKGNGFYEMLLFHKKDKKSPLSIIR